MASNATGGTTSSNGPNKNTCSSIVNRGVFVNYCSLTQETMKLMCIDENARYGTFTPVSELKGTVTQQLQEISFVEEFVAIAVLLFGPPNGIISIPLLSILIGHFGFDLTMTASLYYLSVYILLPLILIPQPFIPSTLTSYVSTCIVKYFSFRFITYEIPSSTGSTISTSTSTDTSSNNETTNRRPQILVAPPHGVFPYGNILALLVWPSIFGTHFRGLAANAALRVPVFKQILKSIGVIDASRDSAAAALQSYPNTIGISTGGVAEVFETNATDECILLTERIGLIKLAIRTGADVVPCYLFGNTHLLSCWAGEGIPNGRLVLEKISRKIGFALIFFYGRWCLPLPRRVPVLGVRGKGIPTFHYNCPKEPSKEQVDTIQKKLINDMQELFDGNKIHYGWNTSRLVIK